MNAPLLPPRTSLVVPLPDGEGADEPSSHRHRTIWISDVHLGTPGCKAAFLLDFLKWNDADTLYLVGDIVDGWRLRKGWHWPQAHNDVVQKLLRKARKGTRVVYVPGNHDEFARDFFGHAFGGIELVSEAVHRTADGRRLLVTHGDLYDAVVQRARWLAVLGDTMYTLILALNHSFNRVRARLGFGYWSLSQYLKHRAKAAVSFITDFEVALARAARERGLDGVVCGHIHKAEIRMIDGILYCNDGDWVESLTALVEDEHGQLRLMQWSQIRADETPLIALPASPGKPAAPALAAPVEVAR
ncbi:UDP-2,3-diacylglucosamine diphosphatase [Arenimonas sp. MALMAid1274]|uniref:UDP-2,3-diacylglucosamine diphosphatase n=1 Tax=Arenimonas sp. MALMAid1274 TaxID=3411630 RepID=UPI003B9E262A